MPERIEGEPLAHYLERAHFVEAERMQEQEIPRVEIRRDSRNDVWHTIETRDPYSFNPTLDTNFTGAPIPASTPGPALLPVEVKLLQKNTRSVIETLENRIVPRRDTDSRESAYLDIIRTNKHNRTTPREVLSSEVPQFLPYVGYDILTQLAAISNGKLFRDEGNWAITCFKSGRKIPIDYAFVCLGHFYGADSVPTPQLCASCDFVKPECTELKDYTGKLIWLCTKCIGHKYMPCNQCSRKILPPFYGIQVCIDCIAGAYTERPLRHFNLGTRWVGEKPGAIMQSPRVFSFEVETLLKNPTTLNYVGNNIPADAGLSGDSSIRGRGMGAEIQSPKLSLDKGEDFTNRIAGVLKRQQAKVNESCGMHVHLDGAGIISHNRQDYPQALVELWKAHLVFEDVIFSILPYMRRLNRYCRPMRDYFKLSELEQISTMYDAEKLWYLQQDPDSIRDAKQHHHHASRYFGLNLHSLFANGHLELRHHSGTLNPKKILHWANLNALIMDAAVQGVFTHELLAEANATSSLKEKTMLLFNTIGLSKAAVVFYTQRQAKFSDKQQQEDGLTPIEDGEERYFRAPSSIIPRFTLTDEAAEFLDEEN